MFETACCPFFGGIAVNREQDLVQRGQIAILLIHPSQSIDFFNVELVLYGNNFGGIFFCGNYLFLRILKKKNRKNLVLYTIVGSILY